MKLTWLTIKIGITIILLLIVLAGSISVSNRFSASKSNPSPVPIESKAEVIDYILLTNSSTEKASSPKAKEALNLALNQLQTRYKEGAITELKHLVEKYPNSLEAELATETIGEFNLDQFYDTDNNLAKLSHKVVSGDSYSKIAKKYNSSLSNLLFLNSLDSYDSLKIGRQLRVMPLYFNLKINFSTLCINLEYGKKFIKSYPIVTAKFPDNNKATSTIIERSFALKNEKTLSPTNDGFINAQKVIELKSPKLRIVSEKYTQPENFIGIVLKSSDLEELHTLLKYGNLVEFTY